MVEFILGLRPSETSSTFFFEFVYNILYGGCGISCTIPGLCSDLGDRAAEELGPSWGSGSPTLRLTCVSTLGSSQPAFFSGGRSDGKAAAWTLEMACVWLSVIHWFSWGRITMSN